MQGYSFHTSEKKSLIQYVENYETWQKNMAI